MTFGIVLFCIFGGAVVVYLAIKSWRSYTPTSVKRGGFLPYFTIIMGAGAVYAISFAIFLFYAKKIALQLAAG
jgi:hypothetical protein